MVEPHIMMTRGNGVGLNVAIWEGQGKNILCIHGLTANGRCWDTIAGKLAPDHRIIAMDLRGRGLSDKPETGYSVPYHVEDICILMDEIKLHKPVVMGHSLGAYIAVALAAGHPHRVDSMILLDGGGMLSQVQMDQFQNAIKPSLDRLGQVFSSFEDYIAPMKLAPFFQPWTDVIENYFRSDVIEENSKYSARVKAEAIIEEALNLQQMDFRPLYPLVVCRTLILRATTGILSPADILLPDDTVQEMLHTMKQARCVDLEGTNHYSVVFQPNEVRDRIIRNFLQDSI